MRGKRGRLPRRVRPKHRAGDEAWRMPARIVVSNPMDDSIPQGGAAMAEMTMDLGPVCLAINRTEKESGGLRRPIPADFRNALLRI
jgi:hypothetical protein